MSIEAFSQTYWYIWLLTGLLLAIILILNIGGYYFYNKRRNEFLKQQANSVEDIPMEERSPTQSSNGNTPDPTKYRALSELTGFSKQRFMIESPFYTQQAQLPSNLNTVTAISASNPSDRTKTLPRQSFVSGFSIDTALKGEDIDLDLEQFQREALKEHNDMRYTYKKPLLKLSDSLNVYAQYWAEQCARTNCVAPSRPEWRAHHKGQTVGENIISLSSTFNLDGAQFTALIMAHGNHSKEVDCVLNDLTTEVGFGRALTKPEKDKDQSRKWIAVAHYFPYRQLTNVQS